MKCSLALVAATVALTAAGDDCQYLRYEEFIRHVERGAIHSVEVDNYSSISGVMTNGGEERRFRTFGRTGSANDPLLMRLLNEHDVSVAIREDEDRESMRMMLFSSLMFAGAPLLVLVLLIVMLVKINHILANQRAYLQLWEVRPRTGKPSNHESGQE